MTISRSIRKRLRRYALLCLMAATTVGGADTTGVSWAGDTHDSSVLVDADWDGSDLCGWIEELSETTFSEASVEQRKPKQEILVPQFLAVNVSDELSIDTCNYDVWRNETLKAPSGQTTASEPQAGTGASVAKVTSKIPFDTDDHVAKKSASRTSSDFNSALAAIAASATAGNPLPFGHWTEPFAMVGPAGSHSVDQIRSFQNWYSESKRLIAQMTDSVTVDFVPVVDFDGELKAAPLGDAKTDNVKSVGIARAKPNEAKVSSTEANDDGRVLLVETTPSAGDSVEDQQETDDIAPAEIADVVYGPVVNPLLGSSAMIATIQEAYQPYDLAERDLTNDGDTDAGLASSSQEPSSDEPAIQDADHRSATEDVATDDSQPGVEAEQQDVPQVVWADGIFLSPRQPFCIHSLIEMQNSDWSPLAKNVKLETKDLSEADSIQAVATAEPSVQGSADCLLDELIWKVNVALEDDRVTTQWFQPFEIGQDIASLVVSGDRLATRLASELALVWPANAAPAKPMIGSGAKLLARAEAVERVDVQPLVAEQRVGIGSLESETQQQLAQASAKVLQWVNVAQSVIDDVSNQLSNVTEVARTRGTQDDLKRR